MITLALSKGRIFEDTRPVLAKAGIELVDDPETSRRLLLATNRPDLQILLLRASDVPTFVQYGAADLGIAGKDVLMEHGGSGLYELLDLQIAQCRLMVAGFEDALQHRPRRLKVATKYINAARHLPCQGRQAEIIKLYGSMELAPLVGLADCIVDVVDTGKTLAAHGLVPLELIAQISSRLIANKAALKRKHATIEMLLPIFAR